jgi:hypothetical protein
MTPATEARLLSLLEELDRWLSCLGARRSPWRRYGGRTGPPVVAELRAEVRELRAALQEAARTNPGEMGR